MMMTKNVMMGIAILLMVFSYSEAIAQRCGSIATPQNVRHLERFKGDFDIHYEQNTRGWGRGIMDVPVKFHIVTESDGSDGISLSILDEQIEVLNQIYIDAHLRFIRYDEPNYIRSSRFASYDPNMEEDLASGNEVDNVMNVFCVPAMPGLCGYAYFPSKTKRSNRILMNNSCMTNGSTFVHEVGHFFGLYHTHGTTNTGTTDEYVSRNIDRDGNGIRDCEEYGDRCCDTPADPNLGQYRSYCRSDCSINADCYAQDPNGECYEPMVENLMSYNPNKTCRNMLTMEQLARVEVVSRNDRSYLKIPENINTPVSSCEEEVEGLVTFTMKDGTAMPVEKDVNLYKFIHTYQPGDAFTFSAENMSDTPLNLYIINMDSRGKVNKIFPYYRTEKPDLGAGKTYDLGTNIVLDHHSGREYACLLFSLEKLDINTIVQRLQGGSGTFTQRLYSTLGKKLLPLDHVEYKEGRKIKFSGCLDDGEILPVMLEMDRS